MGRAAQLHHGTLLKEAEAGLVKLEMDRNGLMGQEGFLDRPSATFLAPTSAKVVKSTPAPSGSRLQILLPALAIAGFALALIAPLIVYRLWPPIEVASASYLNDLH